VTNLQRRLKKLETRTAPPKPPRLVVRYEGCDGLDPEYPQADISETDENTMSWWWSMSIGPRKRR
jgi:hypothetical protein